MSNFLIFKAAFNNSATPAIGTYTAEGATALFNMNSSLSPDYYLYNTADDTAVQWFIPTKETTDFEFVADILTRQWTDRVTYFIIADSTGTTGLRMWSQNDNWHFENSDSITASGTEYIGTIDPATSGGFGVFHQFRVRVRKLTESSSSVEVYVDGTLKLTATAGAALITCAKIGFVGGVDTSGPGTGAGIKNAYVYDLSGGELVDRGVLSEGLNRLINWAKNDSGFITSAIKESGISDKSGWCLLHGGLLIQWGTYSAITNDFTINFYKAFSVLPIVVANYGDDVAFDTPCTVDDIFTTAFIVKHSNSGTWRVNWIAIGRA